MMAKSDQSRQSKRKHQNDPKQAGGTSVTSVSDCNGGERERERERERKRKRKRKKKKKKKRQREVAR